MFSKVLIANRGEIAVRLARAVAECGAISVAVYSSDDDESLHRVVADEAIALDGRGVAPYLDVEELVAAAKNSDCEALHPGYGFLGESDDGSLIEYGQLAIAARRARIGSVA